MIALTPLEQALVAYTKHRDPNDPLDRQTRADDAVALAELGVFSTPHIIAITGLPKTFAYELLAGKNPDKRGGSLNVEHLSLINDVAIMWARSGVADHRLVHMIITGGTSARMLSKLTGIHFNTIYRWVEKVEQEASAQ